MGRKTANGIHEQKD